MAKTEHNGGQDMDIDKVRELVKLVEDSGIAELEISHLDTTIRIQKSTSVVMAPPTMMPPGLVAAAPETAQEGTAAAPVDVTRSKWRDVRSPIVGTFYTAASPTTPPFVQVGDHVNEGQILCIIEAMKVMNEIDAEFSGTIKEVLLTDGSPIEAEGVMFLVDPD